MELLTVPGHSTLLGFLQECFVGIRCEVDRRKRGEEGEKCEHFTVTKIAKEGEKLGEKPPDERAKERKREWNAYLYEIVELMAPRCC